MNNEQPPKVSWFEKFSSYLIVAFVFGTAMVLPGLVWAARKFGIELPGPIQKLLEAVGIN